MTLTRLLPAPAVSVDPLGDDGLDLLRQAYAPAEETTVRVNMISTLNGSNVGSDGTSESLSNRVDRRILGVIRAAADVVVVGAASVRAEGYRVPRSAALAIVSSSGDLRGHRLEPTPGSRVLLLVPESRASAAAATASSVDGVEIVGVASDEAGRMAVADLLAALAVRGLASVVCEGGPSLTAQFLAAGVVDEVCLSTAPQFFGPPLPLLPVSGFDGTRRFVLAHLAVDSDSTLYAIWRAAN